MAKVNWTFQALEDIESIVSRIEKTSPKFASYLVDLFFQEAIILEQFPLVGRKVPETNIDKIQEIIIKKYRIIYTITSKDVIDILAVRYSAIPLSDF